MYGSTYVLTGEYILNNKVFRRRCSLTYEALHHVLRLASIEINVDSVGYSGE